MTQGEEKPFLAGPEAHRVLARHLGAEFVVDDIGTRIDASTIDFKIWHTVGLDVFSQHVRVRRHQDRIRMQTLPRRS